MIIKNLERLFHKACVKAAFMRNAFSRFNPDVLPESDYVENSTSTSTARSGETADEGQVVNVLPEENDESDDETCTNNESQGEGLPQITLLVKHPRHIMKT